MQNNGKMRTSAEPNKIYVVGKVLMRAIQKCNFFFNLSTVSKVMGIYDKFTKTTHQIWSCHVTLASNSENFYFSPNSVLNFGEIGSITKKLQAKNKIGGEWKTPPPVLIGLKVV